MPSSPLFQRVGVSLSAALVAWGCGVASTGSDDIDWASVGDEPSGDSEANSLLLEPSAGDPYGPDPRSICQTRDFPTDSKERPVDIVIVLDNSGSMADELPAIEAGINGELARALEDSALDYQVILISRHRRAHQMSKEEADTSVCVTTPLSGLEDCSDAPAPVHSARFFHYDTKVESHDSLDILLDTYGGDPAHEKRRYEGAEDGWSIRLREGAKTVFLEITDDDEKGMEDSEFLQELAKLNQLAFGPESGTPFVVHSIIGLAEKKGDGTRAYTWDEPFQESTCESNGGRVINPGGIYQRLSQATGGLRFPICQHGNYDRVFRAIADDVALEHQPRCSIAIPAALDGSVLDLGDVGVSIQKFPNNDRTESWELTDDPGSCANDKFYIKDGMLELCAEACELARDYAKVTAQFTCEPQDSVR